jgi:hypothetical protein
MQPDGDGNRGSPFQRIGGIDSSTTPKVDQYGNPVDEFGNPVDQFGNPIVQTDTGQTRNIGTPAEPATQGEEAAGRAQQDQPQDQVTREKPNLLDSRLKFLQRDGAMQAFKLPGHNRVIHDMRDGGAHHGAHGKIDHEFRREHGKGEVKVKEREHTERAAERASDNTASNIEVRDGKLYEARGKDYENYFNKIEKLMQMIAREQKPADQKEGRPLSDFEKLLVERFEQAKQVEKQSADGKAKFLEKTIEQWRAFFAKFGDRTTKKSIDLAEIQEFLFRGLVKKGDAKAIMISDIIHNSGQMEKFTRFGVLYDKLSSLLARLVPGDLISKEAIAKGLTGEQLLYLALLPPTLEQEFLTGTKPKQGMFGLESIEKRVSEELGLSQDKATLNQQLQARKGKKKRLGAWGKMFGGDEEVDQSGQFIPGWQWGTLKRPGGFKLKTFFYSAVIIGFILVILFLINQYLMGK